MECVSDADIARFVRLLKEWTELSEKDDNSSDVLYNQLLSHLAQFEYGSKKTLRVLKVLQRDSVKDRTRYLDYCKRINTLEKELAEVTSKNVKKRVFKKRSFEVEYVKGILKIYPPSKVIKREIQDLNESVKDLEIKQQMVSEHMYQVGRHNDMISELIARSYNILAEPQVD